jgi:hypothetical protein
MRFIKIQQKRRALIIIKNKNRIPLLLHKAPCKYCIKTLKLTKKGVSQNSKILQLKKNSIFLYQKLQFFLGLHKGKAFSPIKRKQPALQNMKFIHFFLCFWVIFLPSWIWIQLTKVNADPCGLRIHAYPDPKRCSVPDSKGRICIRICFHVETGSDSA